MNVTQAERWRNAAGDEVPATVEIVLGQRRRAPVSSLVVRCRVDSAVSQMRPTRKNLGKEGKVTFVVVVYAPDAQYDVLNEERGGYSQRLGQRASAIVEGRTAAKWKPGKPMPRPTADQLKHPKRLLFSDLKLQLLHCACKPRRTLVVMGDMNTDLYAERRRGKDRDVLLGMMDELKLVSCGQAAWPRAHVEFVTHSGGSAHAGHWLHLGQ